MATTWSIQLTSQEAWDRMYADCLAARRTLDVEQFILKYEPLTARFFELFMAKARAGVAVRILCDMVGSYNIYESALVHDLRDAGVQVRFVNPISAWRVTNFTAWFFRDHRKLVLVDRTIGHTGGVGLSEKTKAWRDSNIRLAGPVVEQMQEAFDRMWEAVERGTFSKMKKRGEFVDGFRFVTNGAKFRQRHFYKQFSKVLKTAQHSIYISTPYLVPPMRLFRKLRRAARRGVDVRILITLASDTSIVDRASQSFFSLALSAGIKIFRYDHTVMHAKTAIVDDAWATIGSMNMDNQSFKFSYEGNIVTTDAPCIVKLKQDFLDDLRNAKQLHREEWERRGLVAKMLEVLTWPAHWVL